MPRIKPEDKTPAVPLNLKLRLDLERKLSAYAKFLDDSSLSYVVAAIVESALDADKDFQKYLVENPDVLIAANEKVTRRGRPPKSHGPTLENPEIANRREVANGAFAGTNTERIR